MENIQSEKKLLEERLSEKVKEVHDYTRMTQQLKAKEVAEERLQEELTDLQEELITTKHKLAIEESKNDTNSTLLEKQLHSEQRINEELQSHLNNAIASLETKQNEYHLQEESLSKQIMEMKKIVAQKDATIELIRIDKESSDSRCGELKQQVATLTDQVDDLHEGMQTSNEQVVKLCRLVEEKDEQMKDTVNEQTLLRDTVSQLEV